MTIICAFHIPKLGTFIGSDSQTTDQHGTRTLGVDKIFLHGKWAVAHTGSRRVACLLEYRLASIFEDVESPMDFTIGLINKLYVVDDIKRPVEQGPPACGEAYILATGNGVWELDDELGIIDCTKTGIALGSGRQFALGAMDALQNLYLDYPRSMPGAIVDPVVRVGEFSPKVTFPRHVYEGWMHRILNTAKKFDNMCGGDSKVEFLPYQEEKA